MNKLKRWTEDPILLEVRRVRAKLSIKMKKDPKGFDEQITKRAIEAGFKLYPVKPKKDK